jgi:phosphohistidine phosphatase
MLLYLIRHAEAEDLGVGGITRDFDRPLTPRGRAQAHALAEAFATRHISIDAIAASPLVRAYQTATQLTAVWMLDARPVTCDELAIEKLRPQKLSDFLAALLPNGQRTPSRDEKAVAAVGHMPDLAIYLEWLIGAAAGTIHMAKAAVACLRFEGDPGRALGELMWLVGPEWFF